MSGDVCEQVGAEEMVPILLGIKDVSELLIQEALAHNYDGWVRAVLV